MNGEFIYRHRLQHECVLDYTDFAAPLIIRQIKEDVDNIDMTQGTVPDRIILWQHQLDWMIKATGQEVAAHLSAGVRIWGIPLEVRE